MSTMHIDPANAVNIHKDIKSQASIGIHWGTFALTNEVMMIEMTQIENNVSKDLKKKLK